MRDALFVFLVVFWTMLAVLSNMFGEHLTKTDITTITNTKSVQENNQNWFFNILNGIPGVNLITPLLKIMAFQYTDNIPIALTLMLDMTAIFTLYIVVLVIRGS